jgi:multicomponent Na+:H+ antiporter subunit F
MSTLQLIILACLSLAIVLSFVRLFRGPSLADRVVALDFMSSLGIGMMAVYAIATNQAILLDVAIIVALISFLGTVAFAYYLERRA